MSARKSSIRERSPQELPPPNSVSSLGQGHDLELLALFLVDFFLLAFVPALGRCIHLCPPGCSGSTGVAAEAPPRDATVKLRIKQVLHFGVFLILNHDGEVWRGFEHQACGGVGLTSRR